MQNQTLKKFEQKKLNKITNGGNKNMSEVLANTDIKRESGKLYFCGTDENGNITVCSAVMGRAKKKKKGSE
jgi:hypothetical protein